MTEINKVKFLTVGKAYIHTYIYIHRQNDVEHGGMLFLNIYDIILASSMHVLNEKI